MRESERDEEARAHLVLAAVHALAALLAEPSLLAVHPDLLLHRLAHPHVAVETDDQVDAERGERVKVRFLAQDERGRDRDELPVLELWVWARGRWASGDSLGQGERACRG